MEALGDVVGLVGAGGEDRVQDHIHAKTEVLTATDMSRLMHLEGLLRRGKVPIRVMHIAEILACGIPSGPN